MTDDEERSSAGPRVVIVGLGPMGVALGRALAAVRTNFVLVGHDALSEHTSAARATGAFDRLEWNLVSAVAGADLVFLAEPLDAMLATLEAIGPHLKPGALVTDTASLKVTVLEAARALPDGIAFVGGHPIVEPVAAADDPAAFAGIPYCLIAAPSAAERSVRLLSTFVTAIGAEPYYIDAEEHDALMAGCDVLPRLVGDALLRVVAGSPSADDLRRLAAPRLRALVAPAPDVVPLRGAVLSATVTWLDRLIDDLYAVRQSLTTSDPEAREALSERAAVARERWLEGPTEPLARATKEALEQRSGIRDLLFGRIGRSGRLGRGRARGSG